MATDSRKLLKRGFKECLTKNSHTVDEYFKELKINYLRVGKDTKLSEHFEQSNIVSTDLCKFVDPIFQKRSLENSESLPVKAGIGGEGGFLKICL